MVCEAKEGVGFYRPRRPKQTPFYQLACRAEALHKWVCQAQVSAQAGSALLPEL